MRSRRALALAGVALAAGCAPTGAATVGPDTPVPPTGASASPECPAAGVRLELSEVNAAMGLRVLGVVLTNCGRSPYRVQGYPAVRALDDRRAELRVRVLHGVEDITSALPNRDGPPSPVVLQPGESADAVVVWRNTYTDVTRPPILAPYLRIAPEPGRRAEVLAPEGGVDLGSTGRLGVSPWQARTAPAAPRPARPPAVPQPSTSNEPFPLL